jgi:hypothetical protein
MSVLGRLDYAVLCQKAEWKQATGSPEAQEPTMRALPDLGRKLQAASCQPSAAHSTNRILSLSGR